MQYHGNQLTLDMLSDMLRWRLANLPPKAGMIKGVPVRYFAKCAHIDRPIDMNYADGCAIELEADPWEEERIVEELRPNSVGRLSGGALLVIWWGRWPKVEEVSR